MVKTWEAMKKTCKEENTRLWRKLFAEIIHFPPFLCFPCTDCIPLPFPSFSRSLTLSLFHIPFHVAYLLPPFCNKPQLSSPLSISLSSSFFFSLSPPHSAPLHLFLPPSTSFCPHHHHHYLTLWLDAQWLTPLLKPSEMEGGREGGSGERKKEIARDRAKAGEYDREKYRK